MNATDVFRREFDRLAVRLGIEPAVAAAESEHLLHAIAVVELEKERTNHVVQPGTKSAAGHDARPRFLRVKEKLRARPTYLELHSWLRAHFNSLRDANVVANSVLGGLRWEAGFSKIGSLHAEKQILPGAEEPFHRTLVLLWADNATCISHGTWMG